MNLTKLIFFLFVFLVVYLAQDSIINSPSTELSLSIDKSKKKKNLSGFSSVKKKKIPIDEEILTKRKMCTNEIYETFSIWKVQKPDRKFYAKQAFYDMRISSNLNEDSFTFVHTNITDGGSTSSGFDMRYIIKHDARAYHEYIFPFLDISDEMETPAQYCSIYKYHRPRYIRINDSEEGRCLNQLTYNMVRISENKYEVLKSIYDNIVYDQLTEDDDFTKNYMNRIISHFKPKGLTMDFPFAFCDKRHSPETVPEIIVHID